MLSGRPPVAALCSKPEVTQGIDAWQAYRTLSQVLLNCQFAKQTQLAGITAGRGSGPLAIGFVSQKTP